VFTYCQTGYFLLGAFA